MRLTWRHGRAVALLTVLVSASAITGCAAVGRSAGTPSARPQSNAVEAAAQGAPSCTYGAVAASFSAKLELGLATAPSPVVQASSLAAVQAEFAGGTILDQQRATFSASGVSSLTNRPVLAFLVQGGPTTPAAGPPGTDVGPLSTACAVSMYDLTTGEFVINLRILVPNGP